MLVENCRATHGTRPPWWGPHGVVATIAKTEPIMECSSLDGAVAAIPPTAAAKTTSIGVDPVLSSHGSYLQSPRFSGQWWVWLGDRGFGYTFPPHFPLIALRGRAITAAPAEVLSHCQHAEKIHIAVACPG